MVLERRSVAQHKLITGAVHVMVVVVVMRYDMESEMWELQNIRLKTKSSVVRWEMTTLGKVPNDERTNRSSLKGTYIFI